MAFNNCLSLYKVPILKDLPTVIRIGLIQNIENDISSILESTLKSPDQDHVS